MTITAPALLARIKSGQAPVILDVRSKWEFDRGHVPGAIHIPFWRIDRHDVPATDNDELVVYCGHGPRAWWAKSALERLGFTRVDLLDGHWSGWMRAGMPQERDDL